MKSVANIQKITKAMKMVAASKMRAAQAATENSRGMAGPMIKLLGDLPNAEVGAAQPSCSCVNAEQPAQRMARQRLEGQCDSRDLGTGAAGRSAERGLGRCWRAGQQRRLEAAGLGVQQYKTLFKHVCGWLDAAVGAAGGRSRQLAGAI